MVFTNSHINLHILGGILSLDYNWCEANIYIYIYIYDEQNQQIHHIAENLWACAILVTAFKVARIKAPMLWHLVLVEYSHAFFFFFFFCWGRGEGRSAIRIENQWFSDKCYHKIDSPHRKRQPTWRHFCLLVSFYDTTLTSKTLYHELYKFSYHIFIHLADHLVERYWIRRPNTWLPRMKICLPVFL